jgi:hypothetical protein
MLRYYCNIIQSLIRTQEYISLKLVTNFKEQITSWEGHRCLAGQNVVGNWWNTSVHFLVDKNPAAGP